MASGETLPIARVMEGQHRRADQGRRTEHQAASQGKNQEDEAESPSECRGAAAICDVFSSYKSIGITDQTQVTQPW
jgi:hypothetical protein